MGRTPIMRAKDVKLEGMASLADEFSKGGWQPARKVLSKVEAVPTIFPQFDYMNRVGGLPLARIMTLHGPSSHGKTKAALGMLLSFLKAKHFAALIDAESTTPHSWCSELMAEYADSACFMASRPDSYEDANDGVRNFCTTIAEAREKGRIPPNTSGLVVVDSLRKLVPKDFFAKLMKKGADEVGFDGMGGRGAQIKAGINAQWLDEIVSLLNATNCALVLIVREYEDANASALDKKFGNDYKIAGGGAPIYDSSLVVRVTRASWIARGGESKEVLGERHLLRIWKTKVAGKSERTVDCYFHTSNGVMIPEGYDLARDLIELAIKFEMMKQEGAWIRWGDRSFNGVNQAVEKITADPAVLAELDAQVRSGFGQDLDEESAEVSGL